MSVNVNGVLSDARGLVTRLQDKEKLADSLISQTQTLHERINCMKEYREEITQLNQLSQNRPRSHLVLSLQKENRQIKYLQDENRLLRVSLRDHQTALELIMAKYRRHMQDFIRLQQLEKILRQHMNNGFKFDDPERQRQLAEFATVFSECLRIGEEQSHKDEEEMTHLRIENRTLRELLKIAQINDKKLGKEFHRRIKDATGQSPVRASSASSSLSRSGRLGSSSQASSSLDPTEDDDSSASSTPTSEQSETTLHCIIDKNVNKSSAKSPVLSAGQNSNKNLISSNTQSSAGGGGSNKVAATGGTTTYGSGAASQPKRLSSVINNTVNSASTFVPNNQTLVTPLKTTTTPSTTLGKGKTITASSSSDRLSNGSSSSHASNANVVAALKSTSSNSAPTSIDKQQVKRASSTGINSKGISDSSKSAMPTTKPLLSKKKSLEKAATDGIGTTSHAVVTAKSGVKMGVGSK